MNASWMGGAALKDRPPLAVAPGSSFWDRGARPQLCQRARTTLAQRERNIKIKANTRAKHESEERSAHLTQAGVEDELRGGDGQQAEAELRERPAESQARAR